MSRDALIEKLKADVAEGRVVTIAGTGVSVAACGNQMVGGHAVATWPGLLQHGVAKCQHEGVADDKAVKLLNMQIDSGDLDFMISAAETISKRLHGKSSGVFLGWLKDTVGKLEIKDAAILEALGALPGVLATLNYDGLLEAATKRQAVTWRNADKTQAVLRREITDAVLHLHGWFEEPESVVLGLTSYLTVKDDLHAKAVLESLTIEHALLFVGCGDTVLDPNFTRLIEWGKEALKDVVPRHYLLCRTSEIAKFQKKLAGVPWLQPLGYGTDYKNLVPFLKSLVPAGGVGPSPRSGPRAGPGFDLNAYQQVMRKRYSRLKLEELDPTTHDIRQLTLTGMFIAQNARECVEFMPRVFELPKELQRRLRESGEMEDAELDEETLTQHRRAYLDQSPRPILDIVSEPALNRLVVLGDPGSGKSTLLQFLLLHWAEKGVSAFSREPLPLLIELREYARLASESRANDFLSYLHSDTSVRWHFDRAQLHSWLQANPSLVLFDGLDEVFDPALRRNVSTAIHCFADEYPLARIIVTSRIIGFHHQTWRDEEFRHFMLQDLDEPQIAEFLSRWHRGAYEELSLGEKKRVLLTRAIKDSAAIRQLAGNPLLLTMMAILNRTQDLPRDRAELYEQCARLLLHQWKVDEALKADSVLCNANLDLKDKRGLLLRVARVMQTSERGLAGNLIDETTLERTLAEGLKSIPNLRPDRAASALIEQLRGRNFMLCSVGGRSYAFVHRTFLEYFCAVEIRERFQTEQSLTPEQLKTDIFGHWPDETWHEVLCLLAGMIAPHFVAEILKWLLARRDPSDTCHSIFLAARCIGEVRKRAELGPVASAVLDRVKALTQFDLHYTYKSLKNKAQRVAAVHARAVSVIAVTWKENPETLPWLKERAQTDKNYGVRRSSVQELARGWKEDPEILPILKERAQTDDHGVVRRSAVEELARGWKEDARTLPWLKVCAQTDEDWAVRRSAVQELSRWWKEDAETLPWLKERAQTDKDSDVCRSAVQELARGWKEDPETLPWLKEQAQTDKDSDVRQSALEELARGWKEDPETLPWLKERARFDKSDKVRESALEELARGWKEDPETLPILQTRARADKSSDVRRSAMQELARGWKEDPETLLILKERAQTDKFFTVRQSAVEEIARGWKKDPETLPWLKERAQTDEDNYVRQSAVEELARGWKEDARTLPWLKVCAQTDEDWAVRRSAVQELSRWWKEDAETLPWLKERALTDKNSGVRQSAVRELARGWKEDPETLLWLKERAQTDKDSDVRRSAVQELAQGWKKNAETLSWLKERAQTDKSYEVRQSTVRELAREWKEDPETLPWLKERAQTDEDSTVRQSAVEEIVLGWKEDPETLLWLKERAQTDKSSAVRQSAVQALARVERGSKS